MATDGFGKMVYRSSRNPALYRFQFYKRGTHNAHIKHTYKHTCTNILCECKQARNVRSHYIITVIVIFQIDRSSSQSCFVVHRPFCAERQTTATLFYIYEYIYMYIVFLLYSVRTRWKAPTSVYCI